MKKILLLIFGLLPMMLSAQLPKPPYTTQETIALMPKFPTLDGMLAYALGFTDYIYTDNRSSSSYSDQSDLSRFMGEYNAVMEAYKIAMDRYTEELSSVMNSSTSAIMDSELNQSRQELGGMNVQDFQNLSQADQEKIATSAAYSSAEAQMAQMGISGVDVMAMSQMSEKEAEEYMNQKLSASTGISEKELAKIQKMSDKELEAYLSKPENRGKMEALQKMAGGAQQIQSQVQAPDQPLVTAEEITEMENLSKEIGLLWNNLSIVEDNAMKNAQTIWDTEYKARYRVEYEIMLGQMGLITESLLSEAESKVAKAKYDAVRKKVSGMEKDYYRQTIPLWRNMVISVLTSISEEIIPKTDRLYELTAKRNTMVPDKNFQIQSDLSEITRVMAALQAYMETGEKFSNYYIPEFYKYTEN